jgi:pimeloyl-ACP methyl ester carboxylesterase
MTRPSITALLALFVFAGCASDHTFVKHDVAISSDSERIAYRAQGSGDTSLIFIHGWSCDSRYWRNQCSTFAKDYRVIAIDLPGHGHSSSGRVDCTMRSFAEDVKAVLDRENVGKAVLVGHSLGGGVVAEAARLMPDRIPGIVCVDSIHNIAEKVPQEVVDGMVKPFRSDFRKAMQNFVSTMFPKGADEKLVRWIKEDMSSAHEKTALSALKNYLGQHTNGEVAKVFENLTLPVVCINARQWPTNAGENQKHIKNYKLIYIEGPGHFPMLEKPDNFNDLLTEALEYIESANGKGK